MNLTGEMKKPIPKIQVLRATTCLSKAKHLCSPGIWPGRHPMQ